MNAPWSSLSPHELLTELDSTERAIARSRTFHLRTDLAGETRAHVTPELLALAERERLIVDELRRRTPTSA